MYNGCNTVIHLLKGIITFIMSVVLDFFENSYNKATNAFKQVQNMFSVHVLDEHIYLLDFQADYAIDELLRTGVSSIGDLVKFVVARSPFLNPKKELGVCAGGGCSTFDAFTPSGDHTLGRNFDFKDAPCFVLWTHPQNHYASISVIDTNFMVYGTKRHKYKKTNSAQTIFAPYCCVDGLNDQGLSIAVLQVKACPTRQIDVHKKNITTTAMIRGVLDTCANVDEAIAFLSKYNMHDSLGCLYHYQIIDRSGRSVVAEYVSDKLYVYEKGNDARCVAGSVFEDDGIDFQYVTNFTVTKDIGDAKIEQHGEDRAETIVDVLKEKKGVMTELESMDLLSHVKLNYKHPKYPWNIVALWSAVYNTNQGTLKLAANMDYSRIYTFRIDRPCEVISTESISHSAYPTKEWSYL